MQKFRHLFQKLLVLVKVFARVWRVNGHDEHGSKSRWTLLLSCLLWLLRWPCETSPVHCPKDFTEDSIPNSSSQSLHSLCNPCFPDAVSPSLRSESSSFCLCRAKKHRLGKTRNFRTYFGPGSDSSSADKLSLGLKFNRWDTGVTFRPEWRSMSETVFTHYDPVETWYTCQSDVWLDDVKSFDPRLMRCVIVIHPYPMETKSLLTESAFLSCAKTYVDETRVSPDLHNDKRVTMNKRQRNEIPTA